MDRMEAKTDVERWSFGLGSYDTKWDHCRTTEFVLIIIFWHSYLHKLLSSQKVLPFRAGADCVREFMKLEIDFSKALVQARGLRQEYWHGGGCFDSFSALSNYPGNKGFQNVSRRTIGQRVTIMARDQRRSAIKIDVGAHNIRSEEFSMWFLL